MERLAGVLRRAVKYQYRAAYGQRKRISTNLGLETLQPEDQIQPQIQPRSSFYFYLQPFPPNLPRLLLEQQA